MTPEDDYRLRDASDDDLPWLEDLRRRAYSELFAATWGGWDEDRHRRHFRSFVEAGPVSIVEAADGTPVGVVQLIEGAAALEIAEIQIDPTYQGRGIGTTVLRSVIAGAESEGRAVHLRVGLRNEGAIRLYERLGFEAVGKSETHRMMRRPAP